MMRRMSDIILGVIFLVGIYAFIPSHSYASTIIFDNFNGNGELNSYNAQYQLVYDFHPGTGTLSVFNDHIETTGYDPGYVYTAIPGDSMCASIDFSWLGKSNNGAYGGWTNILIHTTPDKFGIGVQIRSDSPTQQRWVVYNSDTDQGAPSVYQDGIVSFDLSQSHTLKACVKGQQITGFLDDSQLFTYNDTYYPVGYVGFASQSPTHYLDNFKIETISPLLNVPILKQNSNPWGPTLYDSANLWAGNNSDMSRWGCAVTSAAMVFKYHGIEKMPDNSDLDPGTLNAWLKSQPDGYVLNGYVNWLALSRLSLLSKPNNSYDGFDALEYNRISGENKTQLMDDITNKIPGILEEPGHFIVAKGEDVTNSSFLINDPYYSRDSLLDYGDTFLSLGRFIPSQTDLSYIMFVVDKDININLKDSNGNEVGESYIQEPIINPLGDSEGGSAIKMLYLQKPADGNYSLEVSSPSTANYLLDGYLYDKDGKVKKIDLNGVVGVGDVDTYQITQNKENVNQGGIKQVVTFDSLKRDIALFYKAGKIRNFGKYAAWTAQVDQAKFISRISKKGAKAILQALRKQITSEKKAIDSVSKGILLNEIGILISAF